MLVAQSCPTLCDPMDYSSPGSPVHGILQARILQWVAISSSTGSSRLRSQTWVSCLAGSFFTNWATREAHSMEYLFIFFFFFFFLFIFFTLFFFCVSSWFILGTDSLSVVYIANTFSQCVAYHWALFIRLFLVQILVCYDQIDQSFRITAFLSWLRL